MPTSLLRFRPAHENDCAHLALLADMATRRLASHLWGLAAQPGQSAFEVGRSVIRADAQHFTHFGNWRVADLAGTVVGALNTCVLPPPTILPQAMPELLRGLNELKAVAAGTCYLAAAAVYSEHQGRGFGVALLDEAMSLARGSDADRLTLMVGSFNDRAHRLYLRYGFKEWARRPFSPFPGSDTPGDWILMCKSALHDQR